LLPNELSPTAVPRFAAGQATATSPSGCTACTPVGEQITGMATDWPSTGQVGLAINENSKLTGVEVRPDGLVRLERETG
jgi:hypothetical protein